MIPDGKFGKDRRLVKNADFRRVYEAGRPVRGQGVVLYCAPNALKTTRIGFSISSRVIKRAVRRNRLRRLFRESYRMSSESLKSGFDLILSIKRDLPPTVCQQDINALFERLVGQAGAGEKKERV